MPRVPYEKPDDLGPRGSKHWDHVMRHQRRMVKKVDAPAVEMACRALDLFDEHSRKNDKQSAITAGIYFDKYLMVSAKFGWTPKDREKQVDQRKSKPKAEGKKTGLDELTPDKLAGANTVVARAKRADDAPAD